MKHTPMASAHEGYAVILEELDETWDEIKRRKRQHASMYCNLRERGLG